ncbi:MAG: exodeoxyribonuclease VII large subunit [Bacteroidales bacterium]
MDPIEENCFSNHSVSPANQAGLIPRYFTLLEVCQSVQKTLADRYGSAFWVKAEMHKLNYYPHSGHCYPELLDKQKGKIVAEMRSILWNTDYQRIHKQFLEVLKEPLQEGICILFLARIQYDPKYGLSLRILDIDVNFILGELEKEKRVCIDRLQKEGLWNLNKNLPFPLLPKKIAVISVETSKGFSDFRQVLDQSAENHYIYYRLFPAFLQGENAVSSIIYQLGVIHSLKGYFDLVVIIRGGGGEIGLSCYDNYDLAKTIAQFPLPVLSGIGHSTNLTVVEQIAYKNAITPTELAVFLLQKFVDFENAVDQAKESIRNESMYLIELHKKNLAHHIEKIKYPCLSLLASHRQKIERYQSQVVSESKNLFLKAKQALQLLQKQVEWLNPHRLLQLGYSLTFSKGKLVKSKTEVQIGDALQTHVADGYIYSQVLASPPEDPPI